MVLTYHLASGIPERKLLGAWAPHGSTQGSGIPVTSARVTSKLRDVGGAPKCCVCWFKKWHLRPTGQRYKSLRRFSFNSITVGRTFWSSYCSLSMRQGQRESPLGTTESASSLSSVFVHTRFSLDVSSRFSLDVSSQELRRFVMPVTAPQSTFDQYTDPCCSPSSGT